MDTFACVFVAPHEPSRSTWPVLLDLTRATGILVIFSQKSNIKELVVSPVAPVTG